MLAMVLFGAGLLGGIILLVIGVRGRRINDHPVCRKCQYDLSGVEGTPTVCSECGRDLSRKRSIRIGQRRRRPYLIVFASLMLLVSLSGEGVIIWGKAQNVDWITYKPYAWLVWEAKNPNHPNAPAAIEELATRMFNLSLNHKQNQELIEYSFTKPGEVVFGTMFLEVAWMSGLMNEQQIKQFLQGIMETAFDVKMRDRVRAGGSWPVQFSITRIQIPRVSQIITRTVLLTRGKLSAHYLIMLDSARLDGMRIELPPAIADFSFEDYISDRLEVYWTGLLDAPKEPGNRTLDLTFTFIINGTTVNSGSQGGLSAGQSATWKATYTRNVLVVDASESTVPLALDESLAKTVRDSLHVEFVDQPPRTGLPRSVSMGIVYAETPPVDLIFDVYARHGPVEHRLGMLIAEKGSTKQFQVTYLKQDVEELFPDADLVDVILRPALAYAETLVEISTIWGEEIILENVPIRPEPE